MKQVDSQRLADLASTLQKEGIRKLFRHNPKRAEQFSFQAGNTLFDFSKTHISEQMLNVYSEIAENAEFTAKRSALFQGDKINVSEDRSVLHTLLRDPKNHGMPLVEPDIGVQAESAISNLADRYHSISQNLAARGTQVTDIVHIGIGGSSLGTQLLWQALQPLAPSVQIHFVGNIDGHELSSVLATCKPESTLVVGVSKTFTTAETLQNIRSVQGWYESNGGQQFMQQVYAVTANPDNAARFGVPQDNTVVFPQWVGGRYSVWSAVSLSAILALGYDVFSDFLAGAREYDGKFLTQAPAQNASFIAAALDHFYVNHFAAGSRAVFAYDFRLRSLVDYLQQLETESNGKNTQLNGDPVRCRTAPIIWGGVGTNVQHSVFQMLHQGTNLIPAEFILVSKANHSLKEHHTELLANGIAQTAALLEGQTLAEVYRQQPDLTALEAKAKVFEGNRPSTTVLVHELTPSALGGLLAFHEHRTFCFGLLCNINSFDQMGVELGKRLATAVKPRLTEPTRNGDQFDASTEALIKRVLA